MSLHPVKPTKDGFIAIGLGAAVQVKSKPAETFIFEPKYTVLRPEVFGEADYRWQETAP